MQYKDRFKPINMYINSTGTTRADGESVSRWCHGRPGVSALFADTVAAYESLSFLVQHLCLYFIGLHVRQNATPLQVGFETEGTAIFDTMSYVGNEVGALTRLPLSVADLCCLVSPESFVRISAIIILRDGLRVVQIHTVGVGVAIGQSCMLLSAGTKGKRFMLPHATGAWFSFQTPRRLASGLHAHTPCDSGGRLAS